jgi:selenocysteine-specific elongation factor
VRVHLGASETLARVVLLEGEPLEPGAKAWAQLRLEGPVVAVPGDRLVLRSYSPSATVAGATVVDVAPTRRARLEPEGSERLSVLETGSLDRRLILLAREAGFGGLEPDAAALRLGVERPEVDAALTDATDLARLPGGTVLLREAWVLAGERIAGEVARYGETYRLRSGIPKGELKSALQGDLGGALFDAALEDLIRSGRVAAHDDRIGIPQAGPRLTPEQSKALEALEGTLLAAGFQPPDLDDALKRLPAAVRPAELARYLVETGRLVRVTSTIAYPAGTWSEVEARVRSHFTKKTELTMADFKELLQVSRKYSVPVLEYLDRVGLTRRDGDVRRPGPRLKR